MIAHRTHITVKKRTHQMTKMVGHIKVRTHVSEDYETGYCIDPKTNENNL